MSLGFGMGGAEVGGAYGPSFGRQAAPNLRGLSAEGKIRINSSSGSRLRLVSGGVRKAPAI